MPRFRGPINLLLGFDEQTNTAEVLSGYDSRGHDYVIDVSAALKKKWQDALKEHGFVEEQDNDSKSDSKADDSEE